MALTVAHRLFDFWHALCGRTLILSFFGSSFFRAFHARTHVLVSPDLHEHEASTYGMVKGPREVMEFLQAGQAQGRAPHLLHGALGGRGDVCLDKDRSRSIIETGCLVTEFVRDQEDVMSIRRARSVDVIKVGTQPFAAAGTRLDAGRDPGIAYFGDLIFGG